MERRSKNTLIIIIKRTEHISALLYKWTREKHNRSFDMGVDGQPCCLTQSQLTWPARPSNVMWSWAGMPLGYQCSSLWYELGGV